jgi:hypothetical protein
VAVLLAWNAALDQHDAERLTALYASQVLYYGADWSSEKVVAAKRSALSKAPDYHQHIADIRVSHDPLRTTLEFQKHSGVDASSGVAARLTLEEHQGRLQIVEETDALTDKHLQTRLSSPCYTVALDVFYHLPLIRSDMARVARENPECTPGGFLNSESSPHIDAQEGYFHPEHFETRWHLVVVQGKIEIHDWYSFESLAVPEAERERVRSVCAPASADGGPH